MNDILDAVEAGTVQARERERRARVRGRKKATIIFSKRICVTAAFLLLVAILAGFGLVSDGLARFLCGLAAFALAIWFGAWLQFMFAEGGLLYDSFE